MYKIIDSGNQFHSASQIELVMTFENKQENSQNNVGIQKKLHKRQIFEAFETIIVVRNLWKTSLRKFSNA